MRGSEPRDGEAGKSKGQLARRRMYIHMLVLLLIFGAIIAVVLYLLNSRQTGTESSGPPAIGESSAVTETEGGFARLQGRWLRPDGGYVVEIRDIDANGQMTAAYFNPRPIHVSRAEASREGPATRVFIELRDINYPGATYTLTYDPVTDQLRGVYYQPALQQSFDVVFVRLE